MQNLLRNHFGYLFSIVQFWIALAYLSLPAVAMESGVFPQNTLFVPVLTNENYATYITQQAELHFNLAKTDPRKSQYHYSQALQYSQLIGNLNWQYEAFMRLASMKSNSTEYYLNSALQIAYMTEDPWKSATTLIALGNARINEIENYLQGLEFATEIGDLNLQISAHLGLGNARFNREHNYSEALALSQFIRNNDRIVQSLIGLSYCYYFDEDNTEKAIQTIKHAKNYRISNYIKFKLEKACRIMKFN